MNGAWSIIDPCELSTFELAAALQAGAEDQSWGRRAAVVLLINQRAWLDHPEFRQAIAVEMDGDRQLCAWMDWDELDLDSVASAGEWVLLEVVCYLAGTPGGRPLCELMAGLDDYHLCQVMAALNIAAREQQESLR